MQNNEKIILDLCGGTGAWSLPYKAAGYQVYVITKPDYDVTVFHVDGDYIIFPRLDGGERLILQISKIYGILAAPPCTHFSFARTNIKASKRDLPGSIAIVHSILQIISICNFSLLPGTFQTTLKFWAMENPNGYLKYFMGKPTMIFQPYEFGDGYSKRTYLWGWFELPQRLPPMFQAVCKNNALTLDEYDLRELPDDYHLPPDFSKRAAKRSITSPKFASAFFESNM
ncbi:MAG TPA: hypothetical protein VHO94_06355 [Oscillospiraceae bacterium]|nr:hypothetical protein [Oscillospiraceae bacterium]